MLNIKLEMTMFGQRRSTKMEAHVRKKSTQSYNTHGNKKKPVALHTMVPDDVFINGYLIEFVAI